MLSQKIKNRILREYNNFLVDHFPKILLSRLWKKDFGYSIDWNNPKSLNEKIQWLICYSDTSEWSRLSDKILVREYIIEKGMEDLLIPLLGIWENANNINFNSLPQKFVLKCNHDSGSCHIVDQINGWDKLSITKDLNEHLKIKFGYLCCEPHYNSIKPQVLAEEYISLEQNSLSSSPIDYKVFCYNGEPNMIWVAYNRHKDYLDCECHDLDWSYRPEYSHFTEHYREGGGQIPPPKSLPQMISAARTLSQGFPQVRIDFYDANGKLFFGEMTFTSACGRMPYLSDLYQKKAGDLINLELAKRK